MQEMTIGERIRLFRKGKGMTQAELADRLGISPVNISQIETENRNLTLETLRSIALALDTTVTALLEEETEGSGLAIRPTEERQKRVLREQIGDDEVEAEIEQLQRSEFVKLARQERRIRNRRREYLYQLRAQEKRGRQLAAIGWTPDMAEEQEEE